MNAQPRPLGVTLLAILFFLNAGLVAVIAALSLRDPTWPSGAMEAISTGSPGPALIRGVGRTMPWVAAAGTVLLLVLAIGLWRQRRWGRVATLVVTALAMVGVVAVLAELHAQLSPIWIGILALRFVVLVAFGWCLLRQQVAAAFD